MTLSWARFLGYDTISIAHKRKKMDKLDTIKIKNFYLSKNTLFFFLRFYLFIRQRQRQPVREGTQAGGVGEEEAGSQRRSLMWGSIP